MLVTVVEPAQHRIYSAPVTQTFISFFRRPLACLWLTAALLATLGSAGAQSLRIAAVVNEDVISVYDVNERMRLIMFSTSITDSPETRRQLGPQVVRALIEERLQMQEAKRLNISIEQAEYESALARLEAQNHLPPGKLPDYLASNGINPSTLESQIRASLTWSKVVRRRAANFANVTPDEINEALTRITANMTKPSSLLAEIFLAVDVPEDEATVRANIDRLRDQLHSGAGFIPLARQFSQAASAQQGGDLGWVPEGQLDPELDQAIEHLQPGQLSDPIRTTSGYHLVLLRDRRAAPAAGETLLKVSRLFLPAAAGAAPEQTAVDAARRAGQSVHSCEDFARVGKQAIPAAILSSGDAKLGDMAPELRNIVSGLAVGTASEPLPAPGGMQMLMVCERHEGQGAKPPERDEVERMLQGEKLEQFARRLIRDLRQTAFVDIRV
jgi:peptidyl-prolyl cis-trans isomerase SurA